jgi:hypothetical protein
MSSPQRVFLGFALGLGSAPSKLRTVNAFECAGTTKCMQPPTGPVVARPNDRTHPLFEAARVKSNYFSKP